MLAALSSLLLAAATAAPALAAPAGLDPSYGAGGLAQLAPPLPAGLHAAAYPGIDAAFSRDGSAYAIEQVSGCEVAYAADPCERSALLFRYDKRGALDGAFGGAGSVSFRGEGLRILAADAAGRALFASRSGSGWRLLRLLPSGRPDNSFGRGGTVGLPGIDGLVYFVRPAVAAAPWSWRPSSCPGHPPASPGWS